MHFDASSFLRLDSPQSLGATASGASFATSTGDLLEVSCYGPGVFRLRLGPNTRPDYGIVDGRTKACTSAHDADGWSFTAGDTTLEILGGPLRFRLKYAGATVLQSITDEHFRGFTRLPTFGRMRSGGQWTASFALASGEPVYGLGEKFGPLNKRGQLVHSQVVDALGVNTGLAYKNAPFAWSPGAGKGAWGVFVHTPAYVAHGVGYPDWSHRSYAVMVDDEALDLFLFAAAAPAGIVDAYTQLTGRAPIVPMWSLGLWVSRAFYKTPEEAADVAAKLREHKIPSDVITLDGRAAWNTDTRFDFRWDPLRFRDPKLALDRIKSHGFRICVWEYPYVSVHSELFHELAIRRFLLCTTDGDPYVFQWDTAPGSTPFGATLTPLPESGIVDFTHPAAYAWWRDAHAPLFDAGVDVIKTDFGEQVPDDCDRVQRRPRRTAAQRLSAALQPLRVRRDGEVPAREGRPAHRVRPRRLGRQPALSGAVGRRSAERLGRPRGVDSRRAVVGDERRAVSRERHRRLLRLEAAVGGALRALAAGGGLRVAHASARHRRARAVGIRRASGSDRAQVAHVPLPADTGTCRRRSRRQARPGCPSCARCRSRFRAMRSRANTIRSSCAAMRFWSRLSCRKAARPRLRCRPEAGTT